MRSVRFVYNARVNTLKITGVCGTQSELNTNNEIIAHM